MHIWQSNWKCICKLEKVEKVVLSPLSALVYDLILPPYDRVSRRTQKAIENRLEVIELFFIFETQGFNVLKPFSFVEVSFPYKWPLASNLW